MEVTAIIKKEGWKTKNTNKISMKTTRTSSNVLFASRNSGQTTTLRSLRWWKNVGGWFARNVLRNTSKTISSNRTVSQNVRTKTVLTRYLSTSRRLTWGINMGWCKIKFSKRWTTLIWSNAANASLSMTLLQVIPMMRPKMIITESQSGISTPFSTLSNASFVPGLIAKLSSANNARFRLIIWEWAAKSLKRGLWCSSADIVILPSLIKISWKMLQRPFKIFAIRLSVNNMPKMPAPKFQHAAIPAQE